MKKYVIEWYNKWGMCDSKFYVIAENEEHATELFIGTFAKGHQRYVEPDDVYEFNNDPEFYTPEECKQIGIEAQNRWDEAMK